MDQPSDWRRFARQTENGEWRMVAVGGGASTLTFLLPASVFITLMKSCATVWYVGIHICDMAWLASSFWVQIQIQIHSQNDRQTHKKVYYSCELAGICVPTPAFSNGSCASLPHFIVPRVSDAQAVLILSKPYALAHN